jgi:hypothetical protein
VLAATSAASTGSERSGWSAAASTADVRLGHQVGGLVQEHPRDAADQVRGLR